VIQPGAYSNIPISRKIGIFGVNGLDDADANVCDIIIEEQSLQSTRDFKLEERRKNTYKERSFILPSNTNQQYLNLIKD
jgi:hypothetical protein